jgi:histidinol-phosphate aminotransferase
MSALLEVARQRTTAVRAYQPGGGSAHQAGKLSSNEAPLGPSPRVRRAIAAAAHDAHRYGDAGGLRSLIAASCGVDERQVVVTNGSDELCYLIATLFIDAGARVVLSDPCYQIDELVTRVARGNPEFVPLDESGAHDLPAMARAAAGAAVVWLPSPHNPTGVAVDADALAAFLRDVPPDCLVVLDEAYRGYVDPDRRPDTAALLAKHPNLIVQRTFSKADAIAGLRVGYGIGASDLIDVMNSIRPPFNVNACALAGASAALADSDWRDYAVELVRRERERLHDTLDALGCEHFRSQANFVAIKPPRVADLHAALAGAGLTVRDGADLGLPGWVRISIGAPPQMAVLRAVLNTHMGAS